MEYSYNVFNQSIIQPAQRQIEKILNGLLAINGLGVKVKFKDVEVVLPSDTTKMTEQEEEAVEMNAEEQIVVNEHLKGMTGRQTQGLLRIVRQYQKGQLTKEQAKMMIQGAFGLTDDQVKLFIK
jgi:metal-dependent amidase/aminoacylase/carboxypeptidase family protein